MEHRYEQRLPCRLDVELYRKDLHLGTAEVTNVSKNGVNICTGVVLHHNEVVRVIFPETAVNSGWPTNARALVTHIESNCAGLIFDEPIYAKLPDLQHVCDESGCRQQN